MIDFIDGDKQAMEDWKNRRALKLVNGNINSNISIIDESGFYLGGCSKGVAYVNAYNKKIKTLVNDLGIPDWIPRSRMLSEYDIQNILSVSDSFPYADFSQKKDRNLIRNRIITWRDIYEKEPLGNTYLRDRDLYLLWGEVDSKLIVDVMDLSHGVWMQTFEIPKRA